MIKSTGYCDVLKVANIHNDANDCKMSIERIYIHKIQTEELRFSYFKKNQNNNFKLAARPLDVTEDELFGLFQEAVNEQILDLYFRNKLKNIITSTCVGTSDVILKDTDYCKIFAEGSVINENSKYCIEQIFIKSLDRREIRFSYYYKNRCGNFQLVIRPLDVTNDEFFALFEDAIKGGVFSKVFLTALLTIL